MKNYENRMKFRVRAVWHNIWTNVTRFWAYKQRNTWIILIMFVKTGRVSMNVLQNGKKKKRDVSLKENYNAVLWEYEQWTGITVY